MSLERTQRELNVSWSARNLQGPKYIELRVITLGCVEICGTAGVQSQNAIVRKLNRIDVTTSAALCLGDASDNIMFQRCIHLKLQEPLSFQHMRIDILCMASLGKEQHNFSSLYLI
jgi:hypothetical protein